MATSQLIIFGVILSAPQFTESFRDCLEYFEDYLEDFANTVNADKVLTDDYETSDVHVTVNVTTIYSANSTHIRLHHSVVADNSVCRIILK